MNLKIVRNGEVFGLVPNGVMFDFVSEDVVFDFPPAGQAILFAPAGAKKIPLPGRKQKTVVTKEKGEDVAMKRSYQIALFCSAAPLFVGIAIFVLWVFTRWEWLMFAGILNIFAGIILFFVGAISLIDFCWSAARTPNFPRRRLWFLTLLSAALLLSNFPAAAVLADHAVRIMTVYSIEVHNGSTQALTNVRISGGGAELHFDVIAPGESVDGSLWISRDGELVFHAVRGATKYDETIEGYVTNGMGSFAQIMVGPDGKITVSKD